MFGLPGTTRQLPYEECTDDKCHTLIINPGFVNGNIYMQLILRTFTGPLQSDSIMLIRPGLSRSDGLPGFTGMIHQTMKQTCLPAVH